MPSIRETVIQYANDPESLARDLDSATTINQANPLEDAYKVSRLFTYWGQLQACAEEVLAAHEAIYKQTVAEAKEQTRQKLDAINDKATDGRATDLSVLNEEVKKQARLVRAVQRCVTSIQLGVSGLSKKQFMLSTILQREKAELGNIPHDADNLNQLKQNYINSRS